MNNVLKIDKKLLNDVVHGEKSELEKYTPWSSLILRPLSSPFTKYCIENKFSADQVTWTSIIVLLISIIFLSYGAQSSNIIGVLLIILWTILDCVDGNIARYLDKPTDYGYFLDTAAGYLAYVVLFFMPGIMVANNANNLENNSNIVLIASAVSTITYLLTRVIHQKHANIFKQDSQDSVNENETKQKTSTTGILYSNIMTFYGIPPLALLICVFFNKVDYFVYFYCLGNIAIMTMHLAKLLKKPTNI